MFSHFNAEKMNIFFTFGISVSLFIHYVVLFNSYILCGLYTACFYKKEEITIFNNFSSLVEFFTVYIHTQDKIPGGSPWFGITAAQHHRVTLLNISCSSQRQQSKMGDKKKSQQPLIRKTFNCRLAWNWQMSKGSWWKQSNTSCNEKWAVCVEVRQNVHVCMQSCSSTSITWTLHSRQRNRFKLEWFKYFDLLKEFNILKSMYSVKIKVWNKTGLFNDLDLMS